MSGGYTHITLAQLAIEEVRNRHEGLLHDEAKQALGKWKKFCIVGSVSPDYPYLDMLNVLDAAQSAAWADAMHKGHAVELIRHGVAMVRDMSDTNIREKCMAWLFGFAAHVATDGTIHPVVNLKVGPYEDNKTEHRHCEMSQDVYAHGKLNLGVLDFNRQISTNIDDSSDPNDSGRMDPDVAQLWQSMLMHVYAETNPHLLPPEIHDWHNAMRRMVKLGESGNILFPFARHVAVNHGLVYPMAPEAKYIKDLDTPLGIRKDFEDIFQMALSNVLELWGWIALALQKRESPLDHLASWSLDTGINENGHMIYWS